MSTKNKIYLYLVIFLGISLIFLFLMIPYFLKKIQEKSEELVSLKKESVSLQKEMENLGQLEGIYQDYQPELVKIREMLIDPEVPVEFINFMEENAQISEQEIEISLFPQKKTKDEPWPALSVQVSTSGSSSGLLKFLEKLENSPYLIEILNLNIKKLADSDVESTFLVKVFAKND